MSTSCEGEKNNRNYLTVIIVYFLRFILDSRKAKTPANTERRTKRKK